MAWRSSAALAFGLLVLSATAWAGESGKWRGLGVLVDTTVDTVSVADQENHLLMLGQSDGVVFNDTGDAFLHNARYQVGWMYDTAGMVSGGYKTFTLDEQSKVFGKYEVTEATGAVLKGTWEFTGGTGKFEGITGQGNFTYTGIADGVGWDVLEGSYEIP